MHTVIPVLVLYSYDGLAPDHSPYRTLHQLRLFELDLPVRN